MRSTFLSGSLATRRAKGSLWYSYLGSAAIAFLVLLATGAFAWVGSSSAAPEILPSAAPYSPSASSCPSPSFGTATNFGAGGGPVGVAGGDFNGDGSLDLAVANYNSDNVSVLLGDGSGGFGTPTNFSVGSIPGSVAVGDFNRDGIPDLAVANNGSNNVTVLLGNGSATNFPVGTAPNWVAVGDFNRDGSPDLVTANYGSNNVSVLLNLCNVSCPSPSYGTATNFPVGTLPVSVAVGDFNRDGNPDLAVANQSSDNVSVLLNMCGASVETPTATTTNTPTNTSVPTNTSTPTPISTNTAIVATSTGTPTTTPGSTQVLPTPTTTTTPISTATACTSASQMYLRIAPSTPTSDA